MAYGLQIFNSDGSIEVDTTTKVGKIISVTDYSISASPGSWFTKAAPGLTTDVTTIALVICKGNGGYNSSLNDPNNSPTVGGAYAVSAGNVKFGFSDAYTGVVTVFVIGY